MAPESRRADPALEDQLFEEAYRFDFFQAVRLLERLHPERRPVGGPEPGKEPVRFAAVPSLSFPASAIFDIERSEDGAPSRMMVAFMGLTGPSGVLPRHYTELLLERLRRKDLALRDFLDLLNHCMVGLFYGAWRKYHFPIAYERAAWDGDRDPFSGGLLALVGLGTPGLLGRLDVEAETLAYYAGLVGQRPHSAAALEALLTDYTGVPVEVVQFVGQWLELSEESQARLAGTERVADGWVGGRLGVDAIIGARVWDQQARIRLRVGPLTFDQLLALIPPGGHFSPLVQLTRFFVGQEHEFDVQLVLRADEVPGCRLGDSGARAPRLGWSSWLGTNFRCDPDDPLLRQGLAEGGAVARWLGQIGALAR